VFGRLFGRTASRDGGREAREWWRSADAAARQPTVDAVAALESLIPPAGDGPDENEMQAEMLDGLRHLLAVAGAEALPIVETQHRVIGPDRCHFLAPVSVASGGDASGKLLLTDRRAILAGGGAPRTWAWHRVRRFEREGYDLHIMTGGDDFLVLRCNTFGDALLAWHIGNRLRERA
jgi:hypothetical protein